MIATPRRRSFRALQKLTLLSLACSVGLTPLLAQAQDTEEAGLKTVAVASLSGYDRLMTDIDFLGELGGRPASAQMLEGMLAFFTQGRGVQGLDKSRPIGLVLQTDGMQFVPLGCLPVADINPLLELAEGFGIEPVGVGDDIYEVDMQDQTVFFKQQGDWTFVGQSAEALASAPSDPSDLLTSMVKQYDLCVQLMAQNIPEMYRSIAIEQMRQGMQEGLKQQEGESDEDFEFRQRLAESQIAQLQDLITGMDEVTLGWAIDSEAKNTYLDMILKAVPGSDIALACEASKDCVTALSGFHRPDAAMTFRATSKSPPELVEKQREQLEASVAMLRNQAKQGLEESEEISDPDDREAIVSAVNELLDAYEAMILSGEVDMAMSLNLAGENYDLIAAARVEEPTKIENAFKKLAEMAKDKPDFPGVQWDADSHAGVTMHSMSIPVPPEAGQVKEVLGESIDLVMGLGPQHAYFAVGPECSAALKQAIDVSSAQDSEPSLPGEMSISLGQMLEAILPLADAQSGAIMQMILESIKEQPNGNDHVLMTTEYVENGSKARLLIEEGVLRAAGAAAAAAAAAQQGGGF